MEITDIKIRKIFHDDSPMKAIISVTFDRQLAVHDIKVIYAREKYFVVMPSRKNPEGVFRDIVHPISSDFRGALEEQIITAYHEAVAQEEKEAQAQEQESFYTL